MLKKFQRLLALAAALLLGTGLPAAPPVVEAPVSDNHKTMGAAAGGDRDAILDRALRRRSLADARQAAAKRQRQALQAKGGHVDPKTLGTNPAIKAPGGSQYVAKVGTERGAKAGGSLQGVRVPGPGFQLQQPDYMFGTATNWHNTKPIHKFIDVLPGLGAPLAPVLFPGATWSTNAYIPLAANLTPSTAQNPTDSDYYEIDLVDYKQRLHPELNETRLRGYRNHGEATEGQVAVSTDHGYLGPVIIAEKDRAVRVKFFNYLPKSDHPTGKGNLFIPVDTTLMGAGLGHLNDTDLFTQNRHELHLHGGLNPWFSDGTPHQWFTPAGDPTPYKKGIAFANVPDMMPVRTDAQDADGIATYFWSNQQSGRLMFYHDHTFGLTRLNVYAGTAAGYLIVSPTEKKLIADGVLPNPLGGVLPQYTYGVPLIIQDKTFVDTSTMNLDNGIGVVGFSLLEDDPNTAGAKLRDPALVTASNPNGYVVQKFDATGVKIPYTLGAPSPAWLAGSVKPATDPTWDVNAYGSDGDLWYPHVYMPNQNPADISGSNAMGRWDYGAWFWPPLPVGGVNGLAHGAEPVPGDPNGTEIPGTPNPSLTPEAFMDTAVVNGAAYPVLPVEPTAYRFRILSAGNDRVLNLSLFVADDAGFKDPIFNKPTEVKMVPAARPFYDPALNAAWPALWPTDGRDGGVPDPAATGPNFIQIGNESGFLPAPVVIPPQPVAYDYNRRNIVVLNIINKGLLLGPAERADVIVDFSAFAGKSIILYNDAPAPVPAFDARLDYYTGDPDQTASGGAPTTAAGFGPNTRTIMRFDVGGTVGGTYPAFDIVKLQDAFKSTDTSIGAFAADQHLPIVPQVEYNAALNRAVTASTYVRIQDNNIKTFTATETGLPVTPYMEPKAIQELFELDYGRMNATLGVELPRTTFNNQTTIPLGYRDAPTETLIDGTTQFWKITHNGVDTHPVHFHLFDVQIINRVGWDGAVRLPDANELGWKETVKMNPLEDIIVAMRPLSPRLPASMNGLVSNSWRPLDPLLPAGATITLTNPANGNPTIYPNGNVLTNFGWEYVWHCHILGHEENDFMRPMVLTVATTVPGAPSGLAANAPNAARADLTWTDGSTDETGFSIQRRLSGTTDPFVEIATTVPNQSRYSDFSIRPNTAYDYQVMAYNQAGYSTATDPFVTVGAQPISFTGQVYSVQGGVSVPTPGVTLTFIGTSPNAGTTPLNPPATPTAQPVTDAAGYYTVTLPYNWTGTVTLSAPATASLATPWAYTPAALNFTSLIANTVQNFVARPMVTISGVITDDAAAALPGVTVTASTGQVTTTAADGSYSFLLPSPYTGTFTPTKPSTATSAGYTFSPVSLAYTAVVADQTAQNYIGTPGVTISGTISTSLGPLAGVTVTYAPGTGVLANQAVTTDAAGNYTLTLTPPYTGTVTPTKTNYVFTANPVSPTPDHRTYTGVYVDQIAQNFTANEIVAVSGVITADYPAGPLAGVTLTALSTAPGAVPVTATTAADGSYSFANLPGPWTGTVTPSQPGSATSPAYAFTPASMTYSAINTDQTLQNYAATAGVVISGKVTNANTLAGEPGVLLTFAPALTATTDASGNYTITLPAPYSGTVVPSKANFVFNAASATYTALVANATVLNFSAQPTVTIAGTISGLPAGVVASLGTVNAIAAGGVVTPTAVTATGPAGTYSFTVAAPYTATITPTSAGLGFTAGASIMPAPALPNARTYAAQSGNLLAENYLAYASITGTVNLNNLPANTLSPLAGVTLTYTGGTTTTDALGTYTINVTPGWTGTVAPSKLGYFITPLSNSYTNVTTATPAQNYTALIAIQIFGLVTTNAVPALPLPGVAVTLTGTGGSPNAGTIITDATGLYTAYVPAGWSGTITPALANWAFTPVNRTLTNVTAAPAGQHFAARPIVTVTGNISSNGTPLALVNVTFSNNGGTAVTDALGNYSIVMNAGWTGTITPTLRGYLFNPTSVTVAAPGLPALALPATVVYNFTTVQTIQGRTRVTDPVTGNRIPVPNVPITYTGGTAPVLTDINGNFTLRVPTGWVGTVTAGLTYVGGGAITNPVGGTIVSWTPPSFTYTTPTLVNITGIRFNGN